MAACVSSASYLSDSSCIRASHLYSHVQRACITDSVSCCNTIRPALFNLPIQTLKHFNDCVFSSLIHFNLVFSISKFTFQLTLMLRM